MEITRDKVLEAVKKARENATKRKFNQSFDLSIALKNIDLSKPANRINTEVVLPNQFKPENKICVFAYDDMAIKAKEANADRIIGKEELAQFAGNKKEAKKLARAFDFFLARTDMMPQIGKILGQALGPLGKMPKPVPPAVDIRPIIEKFRKTVPIRMKTNPVINVKVGDESMTDEQIAENIMAVINFLENKLEGLQNIKGITLKTTMGKPVKIKE